MIRTFGPRCDGISVSGLSIPEAYWVFNDATKTSWWVDANRNFFSESGFDSVEAFLKHWGDIPEVSTDPLLQVSEGL